MKAEKEEIEAQMTEKEEIEAQMTDRQRIFCHEYVVDWNKTRAAKAAGYSPHSATSQGSENLRKPYIKRYVELIRNDIEHLAGVSKLRIVKHWARIAFATITDVLDFDGENVYIKDGLTLSDLPYEITSLVSEIQTSRDGVRVKLLSQENALVQLAKLMGYNEADKTDITSAGKAIQASKVEFVNAAKKPTQEEKQN